MTRSGPTKICIFNFTKIIIFFEILKKIKIECFALIYFFISLSHVLTLALCPCCIIYTFPKLLFPLHICFSKFCTRYLYFLFFFFFFPSFDSLSFFIAAILSNPTTFNSKILLTNLSRRCNISRHKSRRQISRSFPPRSQFYQHPHFIMTAAPRTSSHHIACDFSHNNFLSR
jgi:hypothetical protein